MIKVPEVYKQSHSLYCQSSYGEGERGGDGEGEEREGREEGRERGGKGERREGREEGTGGGEGGGEEMEGVHIHRIVTISLCLCSYVKKS